MKISTFTFNPLSTNCYLLQEEQQAWIIDPSFCNEQEFSRVKQVVLSQQLQVEKILCTHLHFDHIFGAKMAAEHFGCEVFAHQADENWLRSLCSYSAMFGINLGENALQTCQWLHDGQTLALGTTQAEVLHIPGHSQGGLCYHFAQEKAAFVGDSIFAGSIGRTDLQGGDYAQLIEHLHTRLLSLPDDTKLYCGHGPYTFVSTEKSENPYL